MSEPTWAEVDLDTGELTVDRQLQRSVPNSCIRPDSCPMTWGRCGTSLLCRPSNAYAGLRRWAYMLGFGGHFLTKGRRYSVTFGLLRDARSTYRRAEDDDPTDTVTVGVGREELAHEAWLVGAAA